MAEQDNLVNYRATTALRAGFKLQAPFLLTGAKKTAIRCEQILRVLPGKRLVLLAEEAGNPIIVKLMGQNGYAQREHDLELKGSQALASAGILTPDIADHAIVSDQDISYVCYQYLEQATNLSLLIEQSGDTQKQLLLEQVFRIIARMHNAGLYQKDIHLDNFVLQGESIFTLDCASVISHANPDLEDKTAISNLGLFIAQLYPHLDEMTKECFQRYSDTRTTNRFDFAAVYKAALSARRKRMRRYRKKVFTSSSAHFCQQNWHEYRVCCRNAYDQDMADFLDNPDPVIDSGEILKAGNSATVSRVKIGTRQYVVKRYNVKSFWHGLKRLFQTSRAWRSWRSAYSLKLLDISTPEAVALLEKRFGPLRRKSYLLCEYLEAEQGAYLDQLIKNGLTREQGQALFNPLFSKMEQSLISHGDFKATNFFVQVKRIFVLDLDAMTLHHSARRCQQALTKDRQRFYQNWSSQ